MSENTTAVVKERKPRAKKEKAIEMVASPLKSINKDSALVDWKSFIPNKYIDISNHWLSQNGYGPQSIETTEQKEEVKEKAGEENLIIKLAGFKHLAHLRGVQKVGYELRHVGEDHVAAVCTLTLSECHVDDENGNIVYVPESTVEGVANATKLNTNYPFSMFLESMAENRAFIRAVKTAFNINILGAEELQIQSPAKASALDDEDGCVAPQESLRLIVQGKGKTFPDLLENLKKKKWPDCETWNDFSDIPSPQCCLIIDTIMNKPLK